MLTDVPALSMGCGCKSDAGGRGEVIYPGGRRSVTVEAFFKLTIELGQNKRRERSDTGDSLKSVNN